MATPTKHVLFSCLLLLTLHLDSELNLGKRCMFANAVSDAHFKSRKVVYVLNEKKVVFNMGSKRENEVFGQNLDKWEELRRVPAGPDPLHHNGSRPKKPRNSP